MPKMCVDTHFAGRLASMYLGLYGVDLYYVYNYITDLWIKVRLKLISRQQSGFYYQLQYLYTKSS